MNKVVKDNKVAVVLNDDWGGRWYYTNQKVKGLLFDPEIVQAVLDRDYKLAVNIANKKYKGVAVSTPKLRIEWIDIGTKFIIQEYDGQEFLVELTPENTLEA